MTTTTLRKRATKEIQDSEGKGGDDNYNFEGRSSGDNDATGEEGGDDTMMALKKVMATTMT